MKPIFKRFNDLRKEDINFDFHIHTNQTDGLSTPEELLEKAKDLELKAIAFTEHVTHESNLFNSFIKRIMSLNPGNLKVFIGIETKVLDFNGTLDATDKMLRSDIVIGSVHRYPSDKGPIDLKQIKTLENADEIEFKLAMGMLKNSPIDVLGHPWGIYSLFHRKLPKTYFKILCRESLKRKIAIEINTKYLIEPHELFNILRDVNPYISIGSDAHKREDIGYLFHIIKDNIK